MEHSAITKLIINSLLMILTIILVWSDLKTIKRIISIMIALAFIAVNFYYDNEQDVSAENAALIARDKQTKDSTLNDSLTHVIISKTDSLKTLQLSTKDSIKSAIDSSYQHSVKSSNEALAKYNLQLQDSLSSIKVNANFGLLTVAPYNNHPTIYNDSSRLGEVLDVQFTSGDGSVFNVNLKYYVLNLVDFKYYRGQAFILLRKTVQVLDSGKVVGGNSISKDVVSTLMCPMTPSVFKQKKVLVTIIGNYSIDYNGIELRNFIYSFFYNFSDNKELGDVDIPFNDFTSKILKR